MLRKFLATLSCVMTFVPLVALPQTRQAEEFMAMVKRPLLYAIQPDLVDVRAGLTIGKRRDGSALTVDLYLPKETTTQLRPAALLLHGGIPDVAPVRPTQWRMYKDWGAALAQAGVVTVMFNHRLGYPERRIDEAMSEIEQVTNWLNAAPAELRIDTRQVTAIAFSAGGLLIPEVVRRYEPDRIRRYALFYPLLGLEPDQFNTTAVTSKLLFTEVTALLAERRTRLLIFRSGSDEVPGLLQRLDASIPTALKADVALELVNLPKAPHAFDSLQDIDQTRRAIERAIEFAAARG